MKKAAFRVIVDGDDITGNLTPILTSLTVQDKAGQSSDTASLEIDDTDGKIIMPSPRSKISIELGWSDTGVGQVFSGVVDEVEAKGGRSGRSISISAKGLDTRGKAKQGQRRHFDNATVEEALTAAGKTAGLAVKVDSAFASITREYIGLDNESFVSFGERLAREVGGTFKIVGDTAILADRNGGRGVGGQALPTIRAEWGVNLHSYSIMPILGRPIEKRAAARSFDKEVADYVASFADTGTDDAETDKEAPFLEPDEDSASARASADAKQADRKAGEGTVVIEGNIDAQPEGVCEVVGCRPGIDGSYRIDAVSHSHSRSGFITTLTLAQPKGGAGKDGRGDDDGGRGADFDAKVAAYVASFGDE
ncbi:phage late control D family protein [Devosia ginsengisoli]|uniref:phage late control D family protein n=1 Tax=Devosia ginsengisoli TaxID=400770 RepID=UPI0026E988F4|nr:contractile injection system protein, VgrG/Pvc8 family [Devosia ginsengisoli]MCR6673218.1 contractile injection system protein, VgrG/Pvc8 family [Devosia ginsengisoli]